MKALIILILILIIFLILTKKNKEGFYADCKPHPTCGRCATIRCSDGSCGCCDPGCFGSW